MPPRLAEQAGATTFVDPGCGNGRFLVDVADRFDVVGLDLATNAAACRRRHAAGRWAAHDVSSDEPRPFGPGTATAFVCVDVIEHLRRPERLLSKLRFALATGMPAVLSTPDRVRTNGPDHLGPRPNRERVRAWALDELPAFLADEGIPDADLRDVGDPEPRTIAAVLDGT
jgi:SAM-dependent methyltransferase